MLAEHMTSSSACHIYIMWAELGLSHFLYVPAVSNVVTNGNGMGNKNVIMEPCATVCVWYPVHGATTCSESYPILYLDTVYCKVYSMQA